jgi:hypothetical protein
LFIPLKNVKVSYKQGEYISQFSIYYIFEKDGKTCMA